MKFMGTVSLESDRLIMRRLTENDACDMYNNWANSENVTKFLRWLPHKSVDESKFVLESFFLPEYDSEKYLTWGIELKENHQLIGTINISLNVDDVGEVGYALGEKYWGRGIMTEALRRVIEHCFEDIGMYRINGCHSVNNPASGRVMAKSGMKSDGIAKRNYRTGDGRIEDCSLYSITDDMYFGRETGFDELKKTALDAAGGRILENAAAGAIGAAILTAKGNIYTGVCISTTEVNLCAEQSAIAAMVTAGENRIKKLVSVGSRGTICPPCEKCARLMASLCVQNLDAEVMTEQNKIVALSQFVPENSTENNAVSILESERLRLVPLTKENTAEIFASFTPDVTKYMYPSAPKEIGESESFVSITLDKMNKGKEIVFAVRLKENDEFIGLVGIHNIPSGSPELGIWTKTTAHGNGYGFEAVSRVINHVRESLPYNYMIYPVDRRNHPSRRISVMHGGRIAREYEVVNQSGDTLEIVEYWIK